MAQVIPIHVPDHLKTKLKLLCPSDAGRVLQFPRPEPKDFVQPTWIFPEVDADLSLREG